MTYLDTIEQGLSQNITTLIPNGAEHWFKFKLKHDTKELYINMTIVSYPVSGSGGTYQGTIRYQQNDKDCGLSGPGAELAQSASTSAGGGTPCILLKDEWAYFVVYHEDVGYNAGSKISWKIAKY